MAKLTTVEKLIDLAGEMNVSEIMNYEQGIKLLKAIKDNGIEISEDELLLEVAQKLSRNIGVGMKLLLKLDEEIIAGLIEAIAKDVKMAKKMNTVNNNTNGVNNAIVGGTDMNRVKVEGFKMAGLDGMLKMGAFNPALFSDKEFLTAMEELKAEAKESKAEETAEKADNNKGGNNMKQAGTKTEGKQTKQGGEKMESIYKLSALEKHGYFKSLKYIVKHYGKEGIDWLEEIGVRVTVVAYKQSKTLKDLGIRVGKIAVTEWVKSELDNDIIDMAGTVYQGYHAFQIGVDLYKLNKSYRNIKAEDVEALNALLDNIVKREQALEEDEDDDQNEDC